MTHSETGAAGPGARALALLRAHKKIAAVVVLFAGLTVFRLVSGQAAPHSGGFGSEAVYVELSRADFGTVRELGLYYGTLSAPSRFSLAPRVGGELREILVDIGDRLESGQVVAVMDDEEFRLARDRAQLAVTLAEAQLAEASANLFLARNDMSRQENLSRKSVVAASELEAAENRLRQAEARLGVAESQLASAGNQLADAELKLSYTRVTASWPAGDSRSPLAARSSPGGPPADSAAGPSAAPEAVGLSAALSAADPSVAANAAVPSS
ncbi:MAG: biotin/lipoyl-binding protein, partial [Deltaproteobacteria bacterium]|nr:biotin/lipoyl-binding protein [Deltaproteobacteria bacterium]